MMILCHNLQSMPQTKKLTAVNSPYMVGTAGFEPATPCPPDKYATRLRYAPNALTECWIYYKSKTRGSLFKL